MPDKPDFGPVYEFQWRSGFRRVGDEVDGREVHEIRLDIVSGQPQFLSIHNEAEGGSHVIDMFALRVVDRAQFNPPDRSA